MLKSMPKELYQRPTIACSAVQAGLPSGRRLGECNGQVAVMMQRAVVRRTRLIHPSHGDANAFWRSVKARPVHEGVNLLIFRPLGYVLARALLPTRVKPPHIVLAHTALGMVAARCIAANADLPAALLLQVKTLLDNVDGQLARLRGEESALGRYLDTEADFVANAALFWALGRRTRAPWQALLAFGWFTLVLSWDFNVEYCYRHVRGERFRPALPEPEHGVARLLGCLYQYFFAPQDQLIRWIEQQSFAWITRHVSPEERARLALHWWDRSVLIAVVNFGLTTQYCWLGWFVARHRPRAFLSFVLAQGPYLGLVYLWRILRIRYAIQSQRSRR